MTNESKNGINKSYTYDGNGIRQAKSVNGVYTQHILDGANVIADVSSENVTKYNRGITGLISSTANNTTSYYYTDYHGNVTKYGTTAYDYDAFGNQTTTANNANPFRYCGEYYDAETGLIYLRARYYDSSVGAFVSEDPIKDGLNWYAYCAGNPVNFWDPLGTSWTVDMALPLTSTDKQAIKQAEIAYMDAQQGYLTAAQYGDYSEMSYYRNAMNNAHSSAMAVRDKYISIEQFTTSAEMLLYEGIINENYNIVDSLCDPSISGTELIYANAAMYISANAGNHSDAMIMSGYGFGEDIGSIDILEAFYGDVVCFVEGTLISTQIGDKPIEEIKCGELVYSMNESTGEVGLKKVVQTFVNETSKLVQITIGETLIETTPTHPFWIKDIGWVEAEDVDIGDIVVTLSGIETTIDAKNILCLDKPVTVYNFEVADWHTYFVSDKQIWVHNTCAQNALGQTGYYIITFDSGKEYVGKGNINRMNRSVKRLENAFNDKAIDAKHTKTATVREAFKAEAREQAKRGFIDGKTPGNLYNKIWSPGRKMSIEDGDWAYKR